MEAQQADAEKLAEGLEKTRSSIFGKLNRIVRGKDTVDDDVLDDLEELLVTSDVGVKTTVDIIHRVEARVARDKFVSTKELQNLIRDEVAALERKIDEAQVASLKESHRELSKKLRDIFDGVGELRRQAQEELERVRVPFLCVQPLVENAVRHGLEGRAGVGHVS